MTSPDELLGGRADLTQEERKYRPCGGFDCQRILPVDAPPFQKFCSPKCGHRHRATIRKRKTPPTRQCAWCRKTFIPKPNQKYHDASCAAAAARRRSEKWQRANIDKHRQIVREYAAHVRRQRSKRWRKERECRWCSGAFMPRHPLQGYCSADHRYEAFRQRSRERYRNDPEYRQAQRAQNVRWREANPQRAKDLNRASKQRKRDAR